ncbi:2-phosphosulfolactate phosphatase [Yinghuangia soli]|uniref:Probable 2-phosphosulfolactate phosphatase n=1 Tax=Yinghuangia soli TaxID=2908204 RepID=A0AA41Q5Q8_9ACTN|nr:2-phosphosulfolactate phosphatase [Yinghuangia soli]MCF2532043.1 2-phosphosulfolactate phosphatase [Yinghuangia soli]
MRENFLQSGFGIRLEWGATGAERLAPDVACLVVVDVLSFTTSVGVLAERGTAVLPCPWRDAAAADFARGHGAELAVGRRETSEAAPWSLSPAALRRAPFAPRLVLPSPNGSAISAAARPYGVPVVAASLRNGAAVGKWLAAQGFGRPDRPVAVIASGERWPDGSLRPALEDLLGAGLVIASAAAAGQKSLSPEAAAAADVFAATADVAAAVRACSSGRELVDGGFPEDVAIATELGAGQAVPVLRDGAFTAA